jgi:3-dehydroquinate dehydratase/shikimate dehydrogenase
MGHAGTRRGRHHAPFREVYDVTGGHLVGMALRNTVQEAALRLAAEVDPVARQIGAVNTLVRQADGSFKGFNTDWLAAISAIERGLAGVPGGAAAAASAPPPPPGAESPLKDKIVVVIGAGGAGRALAFGAATR